LTVDDLLTHCATDEKPDLFLNIELEDLQPHLGHINDKGLVETLKHGIGYCYELDKQDKRIVQRLFESGAIQVLVASKVSCYSFASAFFWLIIFDRIRLGVYLWPAIIMGVQFYGGKEYRYIDYRDGCFADDGQGVSAARGREQQMRPDVSENS
jgi:pre-mRNA-splicing helicase BRR2